MSAGENYSLTCTVISDLPPTVRWVGPGNQAVDNAIEPITEGNTTTLTMNFDHINTSDGGTYSCRSSIDEVDSQVSATRHLQVQSEYNAACIVCGGTLFTIWRQMMGLDGLCIHGEGEGAELHARSISYNDSYILNKLSEMLLKLQT
jgi:hypothetical protein